MQIVLKHIELTVTLSNVLLIILMHSSASMGSLCFGMSMGLEPKLDLDAAAAENKAFMVTRSSERQEMVALNDRLAAYIEKVSAPTCTSFSFQTTFTSRGDNHALIESSHSLLRN